VPRDADLSRAPLDISAYDFFHDIRVRFAETDAMTVVHHAAYLPYLEETRVAYLRHLGHPYVEMRADGIDLVVSEVHIRYLAALRFDDVVRVHVRLLEARGARCRIGYVLRVDDVPCASAVTVHGALDRITLRPVRLPTWMRALAGA
jgi:acyl-CoA thioester hydrolase